MLRTNFHYAVQNPSKIFNPTRFFAKKTQKRLSFQLFSGFFLPSFKLFL